jgi:hypothetical protein
MELQVQYAKSRPPLTLDGPGKHFSDRSGSFPSKTDCPAMRTPSDPQEAVPLKAKAVTNPGLS